MTGKDFRRSGRIKKKSSVGFENEPPCSACGIRPKQVSNRFLCWKCYDKGLAVNVENKIHPSESYYLWNKADKIVEEYRENPPVKTTTYSSENMSQEELLALVPSGG